MELIILAAVFTALSCATLLIGAVIDGKRREETELQMFARFLEQGENGPSGLASRSDQSKSAPPTLRQRERA